MKALLRARGAEVEAYLATCLDGRDMPQRLKDSMFYSLQAGGKRLRPVLCLSTAALCGLEPRRVMPFAASIEMIHTYSLIHDDLPAMPGGQLIEGGGRRRAHGEILVVLQAFGVKAGITQRRADDDIQKFIAARGHERGPIHLQDRFFGIDVPAQQRGRAVGYLFPQQPVFRLQQGA